MPALLATTSSRTAVLQAPAATSPAPAARRQTAPTRSALDSAVASAVAATNPDPGGVSGRGAGPGKPGKSGFSRCKRAAARACSTTRSRAPSCSPLTVAAPTFFPRAMRTRTSTSRSATCWWIWFSAKRVRAESRATSSTSASVPAPPARRARCSVPSAASLRAPSRSSSQPLIASSARTSDFGLRAYRATPTWTLRKRAGAAPCPVCIVCEGCPLPQLGVPQATQWSRSQMASQLPQNRGVIPV